MNFRAPGPDEGPREAAIQALQDEAAAKLRIERLHSVGANPYEQDRTGPRRDDEPRRTLDDMRRLSEEIRARRQAEEDGGK
jgi:hypothetical protein